ncbi:MAG: cytochrome c3 family protein, partial [Planctomycetota bacterium]|nr:cytochrome c3 family protein [Planctomycetota bacterium]
DGSPLRPCTAIAVYKTSSMYKHGVGCWECHDAHGTDNWADLKLPITNNELCIHCHKDLESPEAQSAHSHHPVGGSGNLCVECHMARTMA